MQIETRTTDAKARLVLPKSFANATVIVEQVSETEVRVRRAVGARRLDEMNGEVCVAPAAPRGVYVGGFHFQVRLKPAFELRIRADSQLNLRRRGELHAAQLREHAVQNDFRFRRRGRRRRLVGRGTGR